MVAVFEIQNQVVVVLFHDLSLIFSDSEFETEMEFGYGEKEMGSVASDELD